MTRVRFDSVSKVYSRGQPRTHWRALVPGRIGDVVHGDAHVALEDVSFTVDEGESVGIVGHNGAGKSTILKLVAGVITPTDGSVSVQGPTAALVELGAGFHPDMTGRQNVEFSAAVLGMGRSALRARMDAILEFADIGPFLDTPVKRYSSGMLARLGFAVASHLDAEVLVVDEVLAVGDSSFQKRCHERIAERRSSGCAVVYVTHQLWTVPIICDRAMVLERGRITDTGEPAEVINAYERRQENEPQSGPWVGGILDTVRVSPSKIEAGDHIVVDIEMETAKPAPGGYLLVSVGAGGTLHASVSSADGGPCFETPGRRSVRCDLGPMPFAAGHYELYVSYFEDATTPVLEDQRRLVIEVEGRERDRATYGHVDLPVKWEYEV